MVKKAAAPRINFKVYMVKSGDLNVLLVLQSSMLLSFIIMYVVVVVASLQGCTVKTPCFYRVKAKT
jgi:hypothetical protein